MKGVVSSAVEYLRIDNISAAFSEIAFQYPNDETGKGGEAFALEMLIASKERLYERLKLKTEKIEMKYSKNKEGVFFTDSVNRLRGCLERYAAGERAQKPLPFIRKDIFDKVPDREQEKQGEVIR